MLQYVPCFQREEVDHVDDDRPDVARRFDGPVQGADNILAVGEVLGVLEVLGKGLARDGHD